MFYWGYEYLHEPLFTSYTHAPQVIESFCDAGLRQGMTA